MRWSSTPPSRPPTRWPDGGRAHPHRGRRLDLRALARGVLSRGPRRRSASWSSPAGSSPRSRSTAPTTARRSRRASRKWHDETPDDFVFAVKGPRFATNRRVLAEAGDSIERFFGSGVHGAQGQARAGQLAVRGHEEVRSGRFRRASSRCCRGRSRAGRSATPSRCGMRVSAAPDFVALAREHGVAVVARRRLASIRRSPT